MQHRLTGWQLNSEIGDLVFTFYSAPPDFAIRDLSAIFLKVVKSSLSIAQTLSILRQPIDFGLEGMWGRSPQPGVPPLHPVQNL
ncbi:MAG: hypothetical protein HC780_20495 [Leptolyngbyaceae cyanobacterium CSU_1_3]|nr:hypothetical protein [Leptolyngbyaceae cyanobacterium CSU_1_3]